MEAQALAKGMETLSPTSIEKRQRVSKSAFIAIVVTVLVLLLALIIGLGVVTIVRITRNAHPTNVAAVDKSRGMVDLIIPKKRVDVVVAPLKRSIVSNQPVLDTVQNFVTDDEADYILQHVTGRFKPSTTMSTTGAVKNADRTSESVFLNTPRDLKDPVLQRIITRASQLANIPESHMEPLQVVKYEHGQYYRQHFDYLDDRSQEVINHGQRTATILVYLNTLGVLEKGGGTKFHVLDYTIKPEKGTAVLWHNVTPAGNGDTRTLHSGEPLEHPSSIKYAMNIWFRDRPQK